MAGFILADNPGFQTIFNRHKDFPGSLAHYNCLGCFSNGDTEVLFNFLFEEIEIFIRIIEIASNELSVVPDEDIIAGKLIKFLLILP